MITVGYEFELLNDDGTRESFEGFETIDGNPLRACDVVENWYRDTYSALVYWNAWIEQEPDDNI
jgi:hypothetical protein